MVQPICNLSWLLRHTSHIDYKYENVDRNYKLRTQVSRLKVTTDSGTEVTLMETHKSEFGTEIAMIGG